MNIDGVEFPDDWDDWSCDEVVWVSVAWLMRNAHDSVDFGAGFTIDEMVYFKSKDTGFGHLVQSIIDHGFLEDGAIGFNHGTITEGHHRFTAAILLCLDMVPVSNYGGNVHGTAEVNSHSNHADPHPIELF